VVHFSSVFSDYPCESLHTQKTKCQFDKTFFSATIEANYIVAFIPEKQSQPSPMFVRKAGTYKNRLQLPLGSKGLPEKQALAYFLFVSSKKGFITLTPGLSSSSRNGATSSSSRPPFLASLERSLTARPPSTSTTRRTSTTMFCSQFFVEVTKCSTSLLEDSNVCSLEMTSRSRCHKNLRCCRKVSSSVYL